jgi:hypothetical protein
MDIRRQVLSVQGSSGAITTSHKPAECFLTVYRPAVLLSLQTPDCPATGITVMNLIFLLL